MRAVRGDLDGFATAVSVSPLDDPALLEDGDLVGVLEVQVVASTAVSMMSVTAFGWVTRER